MEREKVTQPFIKKYWYVFILVALFILLVISQVLNLFTKKIEQENTWLGITPGYSSSRDVLNSLGTPIETKQTAEGTELLYESSYPVFPNKIIVNNQDQVVFIKEELPPHSEIFLSEYVEQFGQPDLVLYDESTGDAAKANVFLEQGLVILAHVEDGTVEQRWYFSPTDEQTFMNSWGDSLVPGFEPEEFIPPEGEV